MRHNISPRAVAQNVSTSGSSAQSNAFNAATKIIRVVCTTDTYVVFGANPTATSAGIYLVAKVVEFFSVNPGDKVAALQVASGGVLSITEGAQL